MMIIRVLYDMTKCFSESEEANRVVYVRCLGALRNGTCDGLCKPIIIESNDGDANKTSYVMQSSEVEDRLKENGIYQLIVASIAGVSEPFGENLDMLLLGSFGYAEVENEIRRRVVEAVDKGCMEPLMRELNMEWRNGKYILSSEGVIAKLKETGIWQLTANEINRQKKK